MAPVPATPAAAPAPAVHQVERAGRAEQVQAPAAVGPAAPVSQVDPAGAADSVAALAARLRSGRITPAQAVEELIDDAVRASLGRGAGTATHDATPDPGQDRLAQELRTLLQEYTQDNPLLAARVRRLMTIR